MLLETLLFPLGIILLAIGGDRLVLGAKIRDALEKAERRIKKEKKKKEKEKLSKDLNN